MKSNLRVIMPLSLPLLLCQCAFILVSFDGAVCPNLDFVIEHFGIADIYSHVDIEGPNRTGRFVFKKDETADNVRQHVVKFQDMIRRSFTQELNDLNIVSFCKWGRDDANYNIRFLTRGQANHFHRFKALPAVSQITWARIYYVWRPVIMAYEYLDNDDLGFKLLDNEDYSNMNKSLWEQPCLFKRSEIEEEIRTTPSQTLYLRHNTRRRLYDKVSKYRQSGYFLEIIS